MAIPYQQGSEPVQHHIQESPNILRYLKKKVNYTTYYGITTGY